LVIIHGMKILLWHGYLLGGTGSNVYTRALARTWSKAGHDVTVFSQDPHPERYDLGGSAVVRPEIGTLLPVFVVDRYEDLEARRVQDISWAERKYFVDANAAALREHLPADVVFTNHLILGGPVGAATGEPYGLKIHGSELTFSMEGNEELCRWGRESLASCRVLVAGTEHIRHQTEAALGPGDYGDRILIAPPGVDIDQFRPATRQAAFDALIGEAEQDPPNPPERYDQRLPDEGNAARLAAFLEGDDPTVVFVGRISREKGADVLLDALRGVDGDVRTVMVGWGDIRDELEEETSGRRVLFTGALEHRHLAHLWPLADVAVTPSTAPEAFGMVAAEAASCGAPPLVAHHSGLAEIAAGLDAEYPPEYRHLTSFENADVGDLAAKLQAILELPADGWEQLSQGARRAAVNHWSWDRIAALILSAGWKARGCM
jgi:glycosyltransferase involved in cell wall biosynthesis